MSPDGTRRPQIGKRRSGSSIEEMGEPTLPPRDVGERQTLLDMLDYYRTVLIRKADGLTMEQLRRPLPPSDLTIGRLLRHMALVEDIWFHWRFLGGGALREWPHPGDGFEGIDGALEVGRFADAGHWGQTQAFFRPPPIHRL